MKCKRCKFAKFSIDKTTFSCMNPIPEMTTLWLLMSNQRLGQKAEKLIDKTINEINEGEEWKSPT